MKTFPSLLLATALMTGVCASAQTADETPIITFKTNIYDTYGAENAFHIVIGSDIETDYLDVDAGYGMVEAEIKPWGVNTSTGSITGGTAIPLSVSPEGIVKIYGDPKLVNYFEAKGCYIDWIDMDACTDVTVLNLIHNELKRLDLTPFTKLYQVDLTGNTFSSASPLIVGKNHPSLTILDLSITGWIDPDFNLSDYPSLASFSGYSCQTLYNVDPSGCPNLQRLSLDLAPVSSLDVSKNAKLRVLNISDTRITDIDLSQNAALYEFYASHVSGFVNVGYKLNSLDITNNPELAVLHVNGNDFTSIDTSKNPQLFDFNASRNKLTEIDLSANPLIYNLDLSYTDLSFATLPFPMNNMGEDNYHEYYYRLNNLKVDRAIKVGSVLDLSDKILREGTETTVTLYSQDLTRTGEDESIYMPVDPEGVYTYADGKITFSKAMTDSVYVAFSNESFPAANYATTPFMVKSEADFGQPSAIVTFTPSTTGTEINLAVGIDGATAENPIKFLVDAGDGNHVEYTALTSDTPLAPNATFTASGTVKVLIPEGESMSAFSIDGVALSNIDVTAARELRQLAITNTGIKTIDLAYNRNLRALDLTGNQLITLEFAGVNGAYEKYMLSDINISHNKLSALTLIAHQPVHHLDISYNNFTDFPSKDWDYLETANLSHNKLTTADLAYFSAATRIDISGNNMTTIIMPEENVIEYFDCSDNNLPLPQLPMLQSLGADYRYAPQATVAIPAEGSGANLSAEYLVVDGKATVYTWKMASDGSVISTDDIKTTNGISNFINPDLGEVYCEITHPAFPDFNGENAIKTTVTKTADKPDRMIAKFRTPVGGQTVQLAMTAARPGSAVFIDWEGSKAVFEPYMLTNSYTLFEATTVENAEVSVWTYGTKTDFTVFSVTGATMDYFDGSGLDKAFAITLSDAELTQDNITFADKSIITELNLSGNEITSFNIDEFPNLWALHLDGNLMTTFSASKNDKLEDLTIGSNRLESIDLNLSKVWNLNIAGNRLTSVDLSGIPALEQLFVSDNRLTSIDLSKTPRINVLTLDRNYFDLSTLPVPRANWYMYLFNNQYPISATCIDGKVDLSSQARVENTDTEFSWYIGKPEFDEEGNLVGEQLYVDEEYTIDNGVTTFLSDPGDEVMCVFTNSVFPNAYFYTNLLTVSLSGIDSVIADLNANVRVENGTIYITTDVADATAVALYSLNGVQVASTSIVDGAATISGIQPGAYVLSIGTRSVKVIVK